MQKPLLLDLFCGGGGCSKGYYDAGFEVIGVDIAPQPHYPYTFYQDDALHVLDILLSGGMWHGYVLADFAVIHASPECKAYTNCNLSPKENYLKLIGEVRIRVQASKKPYVIENVMGAKHDMQASLMLCGSMFDLPVQRHRLFETNIFLHPPKPCNHKNTTIGVYGHSIWDSSIAGTTRKDGKIRPGTVPMERGRAAMGIDWMTMNELAEAIPPAYTQHIGTQLLYAMQLWEEVPA